MLSEKSKNSNYLAKITIALGEIYSFKIYFDLLNGKVMRFERRDG